MESTNTEARALVMDPKDMVATLLSPGRLGERVKLLDPDLHVLGVVELRGLIESFHKVAIRSVARGGSVTKLGEVIGQASRPIVPGEHVHVHNVVSARV